MITILKSRVWHYGRHYLVFQSCLLPVAANLKQSHESRKFSSNLITKAILPTNKFTSEDFRHVRLALGALWSV